MATREKLLASLHAATTFRGGDRPLTYSALARPYIDAGKRSLSERIALLIERLRGYDAEVSETTPQELHATITYVVEKSGRKQLVVPVGLPATWLGPATNWQRDNGSAHGTIDAADGVMTAASCAIADSGTIALHHGPLEGRRLLSLLPDWHLIVLHSCQIVETLPEYFARFVEPPGLVTWISGPSATADIEMTRIKGVHGPRFLSVIIVHDELSRPT
ncbi:MAG: LUD domain-containing protein [Rhizomicrobium sp.]|nr:LUD domain-containing protein [Rhizomicrobium sp.]